jgi:hypothetical protein
MQTIPEFFAAFERAAASDPSNQADFFAPTFLSASADGVRAVTPEQLALVAARRKGLMEKAGRRSCALVHLHEQALDEHYVLATTDWRWTFAPAGQQPFEVTLTSTQVLFRSPDGWRIVFYRSGDVMPSLRERGLSTPTTGCVSNAPLTTCTGMRRRS